MILGIALSCQHHVKEFSTVVTAYYIFILWFRTFFIIIIIIIKRGWQCKAGRERLTPYQSEDPKY